MIGSIKFFFGMLAAVAAYLILCLIYFVWEVIKLFPKAVMIMGIRPVKITVLRELWKTHYRLLDLDDDYGGMFCEEEGRLMDLLHRLNQKSEKLGIPQWRQNIAYWLAKN
jgi:hypothetical protein